MKTTFKRATALLLSLLMVFSVCSTALVVYAADSEEIVITRDDNRSKTYTLVKGVNEFHHIATANGTMTIGLNGFKYTEDGTNAKIGEGITWTVNGQAIPTRFATLSVSLDERIDIEINVETEKEVKTRFKIAHEYTESFVVLGDSMSNGYGMPGYYQHDDGTIKTADQLENDSELPEHDNAYGYMSEAPDAWATIVAKELEMALTNLSISGMRPTELRAILDPTFIGDAYTQTVFLPADLNDKEPDSEQRLCRAIQCEICDTDPNNVRDDNTGCTNGYNVVHNDYINYITNADVIALHLGMNNFGSLLTSKIMAVLQNKPLWEEYDKISFKDVLEGDAKAIATYEEIYAALNAQFGAAVGESGADQFMKIIDILAYSMAIFARDYSVSYEMIRELNDGADVVVVAVSNMLEGVTLNIGGTIIPLGDMLQVVVDAANTYMAAYVNNDAYYAEVESLDLFVDALGRDEVNRVYAAKLVDDLFGGEEQAQLLMIQYIIGDEATRASLLETYGQYGLNDFAQIYPLFVEAAKVKELVVSTGDNGIELDALSELHIGARSAAEGIGIHPSEVGHRQIASAVLDKFEQDYTGTDYTVDQILYYVTEYYDEAYAYAYAYAEQSGYIAAVTGAIDNAYEAVANIAIPFPDGTTEAFQVQAFALRAEALETLKAAKALIETADVLDQESLDALLALLGEAAEDLATMAALLEQGAVDVNTLAIIPAIKAAHAQLVNEIIPAIDAMLKEAVIAGTKKFVELAKTALSDLADAAVKAAIKFAPELDAMLYDYFYNNPEEVIAFFTEYGYIIVDLAEKYGDEALGVVAYVLVTYGEDVAKFFMENYETILEGIVAWADKYGERTIEMIQVYAEATGLCDAVRAEIAVLEEKLAALEAQLEYQLKVLEEELGVQLEVLKAELEALKAELLLAAEPYKQAILAEIAKVEALIAEIEAKIEQAKALIAEIEAKIVEIKNQIAELNARLQNLVSAIKNLDEALKYLAYAGIEAATAMVQQALNNVAYAVSQLVGFVSEEAAKALDALIEEAKAFLNEAFYNATHADYAIDNTSSHVALGDNTMTAQLFGQYLQSVVDAEDVYYTYKTTDLTVAGSKISGLPAVLAENLATVAAADLITIGYGYEALAEETVNLLFDLILLGTAKVDYNIDLVAKVGPEAAAEIDKIVADVHASLIENNLGITLNKGGFPVADAVVIAVKYFAYYAAEYAAYMPQAVYAIHEINPEALIMINAISNPIAGASIAVAIPEMGLDVEIAFGDYLNYICDAIYLESAVLAAIDEKVVFVPATGVETTFTNKTVSFNGYQEFIYLLMNYESVMAEMFNIETKAEGNVAVVNKMVDALNITVEHSALLGDVDGDGAVTIKDAVLVLRFDAQLPDVALDLSVADVTGDGMVNITDAVWILRYDAKLVEKFPASK